MSERTKDWELYEAGKKYNNNLSPNYYDTVDANLAFYNGDQWRNLDTEELPKPVFNIIKRILQFKVASLTTSNVKVHFEPLIYSESEPQSQQQLQGADMANAQVWNLFDKFKMEYKVKDALFDAAITGDACAHFYFDINKKPYGNAFKNIKGEICMELVDGANVFFGNANNPDAQAQPYIIISGRDMVQNLKEEAKLYAKNNPDNPDEIQSDDNTQYMAGDAANIEVEGDQYGKALYIIVYRKKKVKRAVKDAQGNPVLDDTGKPVTEEVMTITASKSVENAYIYQDIDTGLSLYPISWLNWEKQKNQYHGRAECTGILPNQIFINRMFAMVMYHLMMSAFPKVVYNSDYIEEWSNLIGGEIAVSGLGPEVNISNIAQQIEPANMSAQINNVIDMAMQYTKETLGISDASLGNIDPKNTSAIIAVQKSNAIPLENPKSNLYEWVEDIGRILFDMMGTYYGPRPVSHEVDGQKTVEMFDFRMFKDMWMDVRADVGEASYWSEISSVQTLDNLLRDGHIDFINYLKRIPDEYIPQKEELISELQQQMQAQGNPAIDALSQLSPQEREQFFNADPQIQQQILSQIEQQQPQQAPMQ